MAACMKRCGLLCPSQLLLTQVRGRKVNIRKPRAGIKARRLFEEITKPIFLRQEDPIDRCHVTSLIPEEKAEAPNPYWEFLLGVVKKILEESNMLIVCQALPHTANDFRDMKNQFQKKDMGLHHFNNKLIRQAISDTKRENLTPFICASNLYITGREAQVADMVKIVRRIPHIHILGGLVDNYLLSKEGLVQCSKLPPLDLLQGELVAILNMGASRTVSLLGRHQADLSRNLEQYIKDKQSEDSTS